MKQEYSLTSDGKNRFKSYLSLTKRQVESELTRSVAGLSGLSLHPQIEYAVLSEGKRLRPLLVILSAESVGGDRTYVTPLALAFEFMHTATLVHDDIIDLDENRRGKPAVHRKWSVNDAILTGDALIALSVDLAAGYGESILKTVAKSALELCNGEHMDLAFSPMSVNEEWYFKKIKEKSASLFASAMYCGGLAGGGSYTEVNSLHAFGEDFGIAYQLRDDLLDLEPRQDAVSKDLKSRRINLALIHFHNNSKSEEQKRLETTLSHVTNETNKASAATRDVLRILARKGSLDYCEKKIDKYLLQAVHSISALKDTEYKTYLVEMTKTLKTRG